MTARVDQAAKRREGAARARLDAAAGPNPKGENNPGAQT